MNYSDSTVIIPTLNEEKSIGQLIRFLKKEYPQLNIIVVDDGSNDKTQKIAKKQGALVLDRTDKKIKGISAAVVDAFSLVKTKNLIVMDADFQHPPEKIERMIEKLKDFDIVIGARPHLPKKWKLLRKIQSRVANILIQFRIQKRIKDPVSGFFGIKTNLFKKTNKKNFEMRCFKILLNILKNQRNVKTGYIYYNFKLRKSGQSKISKKHVYYFLKNLIK